MAISSSEVNAPVSRPRGESKVNSVDRALVILEYLGTQTKEVGVRELGQAIGLSKSSVHRILQTLRARGFVKWNPDNARYSLGMRAFEVGCGILRSMEAHAVAKPYLEQLVANQTKYEKKTVGQVLKAAGLEVVKVVRIKIGEVTL